MTLRSMLANFKVVQSINVINVLLLSMQLKIHFVQCTSLYKLLPQESFTSTTIRNGVQISENWKKSEHLHAIGNELEREFANIPNKAHRWFLCPRAYENQLKTDISMFNFKKWKIIWSSQITLINYLLIS